jgi:Rad52/22 family double-strand break repair protein
MSKQVPVERGVALLDDEMSTVSVQGHKQEEFRKMTTVSKYPTELTADVLAQLGAPVPANEVQTKVQGGATLRFTSDKFVMKRLDDVVGAMNWSDDYIITNYPKPVVKHVGQREVQIIGSVVCHLTVLGVLKSATIDLEFDEKMYGTPATNGQARALKRAAMKFGVAAELWEKDSDKGEDEDERPAAPARSSSYRTPAKSGSGSSQSKPAASASGAANGSGGPTEKQVNLLSDLGVPRSVTNKLSGGREGTASKLITQLLAEKRENDDYDDDAAPYVRAALTDLKLTKLLSLVEVEEEENDEDED